MTIYEYIERHEMKETTGSIPKISQKFPLGEDGQFFAKSDHTRHVGLSKKKNQFWVWKPESMQSGALDLSHNWLDIF